MGHSVENHLRVDPATYDTAIVAFIPGYEEMLRVGVEIVRRSIPAGGRVVDLGAGTGAFAHRVALAMPEARVHLIDVDGAMLARARERLAPFGERVTFQQGSFEDTLPEADAIVASLSLHHVRTLHAKRAAYRRILAALRPGSVFVSADATMHAEEPFAQLTRELWADHLVIHGDTRAQALARFDEWAAEDTYFGVAVELGLLREAGFTAADALWRSPPVTVIAAVP
jgi:tRNA (cmo5U34)-methyltransferase